MPTISIHKEVTRNGGRYVATVEGIIGEAELIFTQRRAGVFGADHAEAPENMRGTGVALALVEHMVAEARGHNFKIVPACTYVIAQLRKHPEWADVMTGG